MSLDRERVVWEGFVAGLIGYAAVALLFGVVNVVQGRSFFHTAALLGSALVGGGEAGVSVTAAPVLAYNGLHLLIFLVLGLVAAWLVLETERHPEIWYLVFFVFLAGFMLNLTLFLLYTAPLPEGLPWGTMVLANLLAAVAMGLYLRGAHPRLWAEVREHGDPEEGARA